MSELTVATWNVLHRVHAENWGEDVVTRWPDEANRIAAITVRLAARTERVIALQEVSGDQLASLRRALPQRTIHTLRYPRIPKARHRDHPLHDPGEHLVLLVDGPSRPVTAESFPNAPGKGALAIRLPEALLITAHLSTDRRSASQLARLANTAADPTVLLGDFNADRATVTAVLDSAFAVANPTNGIPTRPGAPDIDHVVVRGGTVNDATVEDMGGLSDHNLVCATIAA